MKASDSVNSLTELTQPEKSCFICLSSDLEQGEPLVDSVMLRNCGCKFSVHPACWNQWMVGKSDFDCPLCRKNSMLRTKIPPNPVLSVIIEREPPPQRHWRTCFVVSIAFGAAIFMITAISLWGS